METVGQMIIRHLSHGKTQKQISGIFKKEYVEPNSLSSIEKMLKSIRKKHGAKTMFHLAVILNSKDIEPDFSGAWNGTLTMSDSPEM